jgi:peptidoglycan hydrolase-like protein with peptidoglycan-binding domain/3D (Asp-Asp-Asp) domain-containing protein
MKNKYITIILAFVLCLNISLLDVELMNSKSDAEAYADSGSYPYEKTFIVSAYYSPLPGQSHYVTGSYSGDIRLNGRGTNGADGTPVYAGMIAAPKTYSFGTKLYIPGIGMTAVHDRGGAIVKAVGNGESGPRYDRLDVWMGYGDKGLTRALQWGMRTINSTVYGVDASIQEAVEIAGYSPDEKDTQEYFYIPDYYEDTNSNAPVNSGSVSAPEKLFPEDLWYLSEGDKVRELQEYLVKLGYFNGNVDGYFGDETRMAIYVFQKDKGVIQDITDLGAGHFGPATREALEEAIVSRREDWAPGANLGPGTGNKDAVNKLQRALKLAGYNVEENGDYDSRTSTAVLKFQIDNNVLDSASSYGAGYFGTKTLAALSKKVTNLIEDGKVSIPVAFASDDVEIMVSSKQILTPPMHSNLQPGDSGADVRRLQQELRNMNLFRIDPNGNYGEVTKHAVFKFQQIHGLVTDENSPSAGAFGSQTREKLNEVIASKNYYNKKISAKRER